MELLERDGYSELAIRDVLHGKYGSRAIKFRYDLLDRNEFKKGELLRVRSGSVSMSAFNTIKRTAKFTLEEEFTDFRTYYTWEDVDNSTWFDFAEKKYSELWTIDKASASKIDWLNDRIQPFVLFQMPDGGWVEFPLGVFLLSSPVRKDEYGQVLREVEAFDGLLILDQDKFTKRTAYKKGLVYGWVIESIIRGAGITKINLEFPDFIIIKTDKEFAMGTSKLEAVNSLLAECNFTPLWVDSSGYFRSSPYERPDEKAVGYTYSDQEMSVIVEGMEEELDIFDVPNSWVVTVSNPESTPITAIKDNTNVNSPTSIPSRGRRIVDYREVDDISSQSALNSYVQRIASESSQVYGKVVFSTPIMPMHEYYDVLHLQYEPLGIDDKFSESSWTIDLNVGAEMTHEVRKVVDID